MKDVTTVTGLVILHVSASRGELKNVADQEKRATGMTEGAGQET
jgi:hypothetical protein